MQLRRFEFRLDTPLAPLTAWARILDLRAHDRLIPFTHITEGMVAADELRPGHRFVACTMLGGVGFRGRRLGFNDVMTVEEIEPPTGATGGHARIVKSGKLIAGGVMVSVTPRASGSTVRWVQDFGLARFPAAVGRAASWIAPFAYRSALRRLLRG
ncbi:hypothetical protein [Sinomonas sp. G460-2]|uniref:hypothetical protein n=1 Tax=Sinomonas sp. G460-2 TaxID=3393464 RepID=UPI0039EF027B